MTTFRVLAVIVLSLATLALGQTPALQKGISVQLPHSTTARAVPNADSEGAIIVSITRDGQLYLGTEAVSPSGLTQKVKTELATHPSETVYIKADAGTRYATIVKALDSVHAANVEGVTLLTGSEKPAKPGSIVYPEGLEMRVLQAQEQH